MPARSLQIVTKCESHVRSLQQQHGAEIGQRDYILQVRTVVLKHYCYLRPFARAPLPTCAHSRYTCIFSQAVHGFSHTHTPRSHTFFRTLALPQRCKDTILNLEARVTELAGGVPPAKPSDVQRSLQQQQLQQQQQQHRPQNNTAGVAVGTLGALNGASPRAAAPVGLVQVPAGYGPGWGAKA